MIAIARGPDKCAVLEGLGADLVIDSATLKEPLRAAIKAVAPKGGHQLHSWCVAHGIIWFSASGARTVLAGAA